MLSSLENFYLAGSKPCNSERAEQQVLFLYKVLVDEKFVTSIVIRQKNSLP